MLSNIPSQLAIPAPDVVMQQPNGDTFIQENVSVVQNFNAHQHRSSSEPSRQQLTPQKQAMANTIMAEAETIHNLQHRVGEIEVVAQQRHNVAMEEQTKQFEVVAHEAKADAVRHQEQQAAQATKHAKDELSYHTQSLRGELQLAQTVAQSERSQAISVEHRATGNEQQLQTQLAAIQQQLQLQQQQHQQQLDQQRRSIDDLRYANEQEARIRVSAQQTVADQRNQLALQQAPSELSNEIEAMKQQMQALFQSNAALLEEKERIAANAAAAEASLRRARSNVQDLEEQIQAQADSANNDAPAGNCQAPSSSFNYGDEKIGGDSRPSLPDSPVYNPPPTIQKEADKVVLTQLAGIHDLEAWMIRTAESVAAASGTPDPAFECED